MVAAEERIRREGGREGGREERERENCRGEGVREAERDRWTREIVMEQGKYACTYMYMYILGNP